MGDSIYLINNYKVKNVVLNNDSFNELETNNLEKILGDDISVKNLQLCSYIEETLPKFFNECNGKNCS